MNISKSNLPTFLCQEYIETFEKKIGYTLPEILKQLCLHIGNGCFFPSYGLFPLVVYHY